MKTVQVVQGSQEYLYADIRADHELDVQAVELKVTSAASPGDWEPAEWMGDPDSFRSARILLDGSLPRGTYTVYAKITDSPEIPIIKVGMLSVI